MKKLNINWIVAFLLFGFLTFSSNSALAVPIGSAIETITIPATYYANIASQSILEAGKTYYILAEGIYYHHNGPGWSADAEWDEATFVWGEELYATAEHDILINDAEYDWWGSSLLNPDPVSDFNSFSPHTYSESHLYWLEFTGLDNSIRFSIQDVQYSDNVGSLTVSIYESAPVPEPVPEPATVMLLGTGLVGLAGFRRKIKK